jgi:hypothetical protein
MRSICALVLISALGLGAGAAPAQQRGAAARVLSPRDTARLELAGGRKVFVDYGRPLMRGRRVMGELVPWGRPWRTGANAATTLVTEVDLQIGATVVPRGTYTLYTLPAPDRWMLIINRQTGQWGTQYDVTRDLVRLPMRRTVLTAPVEQFTIALRPQRGDRFDLNMEWENTRVTVPVRVVGSGVPALRR